MKNSEKCKILQVLKSADYCSVSSYYEALENIGDMKYNYGDYMITEPIDCREELKRVPEADNDLCCSLLTMLLREDHFCNGSFERRHRAGEVKPILDRMIALLAGGE